MLKQLQIAEKREQKLKRKLERALLQLRSLRSPQKIVSPVRVVSQVSDIESLKDEWEVQRDQLDLKMSELSKGISRSLGTPFGSRKRS
jgi:hypothetical protein